MKYTGDEIYAVLLKRAGGQESPYKLKGGSAFYRSVSTLSTSGSPAAVLQASPPVSVRNVLPPMAIKF